MSKQLYVELYNLITDTIGEHESKLEQFLKGLDELEPNDPVEETMFCVERIKKHRAKIKEYEKLLEAFEEEVKEPNK